jgi:hypothetical protein
MHPTANLIPLIGIAPPAGYRLIQVVPIASLRAAIAGGTGRIGLSRREYVGGALRRRQDGEIEFRDGVCVDESAAKFELAAEESDVRPSAGPASVPYLQTVIWGLGATRFLDHVLPGFYTVFVGEGRKSFLSDGALQFAAPSTIRQIAAIGKWADGYPIAETDPAAGIDHSVIAINPYAKDATFWLECVGHRDLKPRFRVPAFSALRVSLAEVLGPNRLPWRGQVYVTGPNRMPTFHMAHEAADPSRVVTVEHADPFRGIEGFAPATQYFRYWAGRKLKALRDSLW